MRLSIRQSKLLRYFYAKVFVPYAEAARFDQRTLRSAYFWRWIEMLKDGFMITKFGEETAREFLSKKPDERKRHTAPSFWRRYI